MEKEKNLHLLVWWKLVILVYSLKSSFLKQSFLGVFIYTAYYFKKLYSWVLYVDIRHIFKNKVPLGKFLMTDMDECIVNRLWANKSYSSRGWVISTNIKSDLFLPYYPCLASFSCYLPFVCWRAGVCIIEGSTTSSASFSQFCLFIYFFAIGQKLIFNKPEDGIRKIVLATNIAETSITINDVVFVIDCGKAKETSYDALNNTPCLLPSWISKVSARQVRKIYH